MLASPQQPKRSSHRKAKQLTPSCTLVFVQSETCTAHLQNNMRSTLSNTPSLVRFAYAMNAIAGGVTHTPYRLRVRTSLWWFETAFEIEGSAWQQETYRAGIT